jgi:hypothetical protein
MFFWGWYHAALDGKATSSMTIRMVHKDLPRNHYFSASFELFSLLMHQSVRSLQVHLPLYLASAVLGLASEH